MPSKSIAKTANVNSNIMKYMLQLSQHHIGKGISVFICNFMNILRKYGGRCVTLN